MDLKLNVSKKGLSTTEEVINEEYTLRYGHIFRGKSAYEYAVDGGFVGSEEEYEAYVGSIGNLSEEAKEATAEAKEAAVDAHQAAQDVTTAKEETERATERANEAATNANDAWERAITAAEQAEDATMSAKDALGEVNASLEEFDSQRHNYVQNDTFTETFDRVVAAIDWIENNKVDKVHGKGLSTNDFTDEYKQKVEEFAIDKELSATSDNAIANSAVVNGLAGLAEGVSTTIGQVSEQLGAEIETKADKEGYYPAMSVGMADNLVGRGDVQDAHINFRPSAGADNITDGAARIERIKGNSVVWNQLIENADFRNGTSGWINNNTRLTMNDDGSMRITNHLGNSQGINQNIAIPANRKILIIADFRRSSLTKSSFTVYMHKADGYDMSHSSAYSDVTRTKKTLIIESTAIIDQILIYPFITGEVGSYTDIYSCVAIDLTKEFGAGNEPTTYEEYLQRKPMNIADEFAYNEGELIDMKVNSLVSVSDNAFDYTKGYARVMGGYKYDITANAGATLEVSFYADGEDDNEEREIAPDSDGKYTFPANGICYVNGDFASQSDVCVCLNHSYDKPHPAYQQEVKDLGWIWEIQDKDGNRLLENGMRDIPKTTYSTRGVCDEILYNPTTKKWVAIKRIGRVEGLQWSLTTYPNTFAIRIDGDKSPNDSISYAQRRDGIRSNKYGISYSLNCNVMDDKTMLHYDKVTSGYSIFIKDTAYATAAEFNEANKDLVIYYELAEPIVVEIEGSENWNLDYLVWDFGTEEAIVPNNVPSAPFRADINYEPNAVDDLRWAVAEIRNLKAQIAQMSASVTNLTE